MNKKLSYEEMYTYLYSVGYHKKNKNIQLEEKFPQYEIENYNFNSILDIGCSQGKAVEFFQKQDKDAYGIDVSKEAIRQAKENKISNCLCASVTKIPFPDNFFDAITTCDVLEHLFPEDIDKAVDEIIRVTKKYFFIKIAFCKERSTKWIDKLKKENPEVSINNLHTSVFNKEVWIKKFTDKNVIFIENKFKNMLVFKKGENYNEGKNYR